MENLFKTVNRKNTGAIKWDYQEHLDNIPFWIADSDYSSAPCVLEELQSIATHGAYGYNGIPKEFNESIVSWYGRRYDCKLDNDWIISSTGVILELRVLLEEITKEKEEVILQTPVYHTFHHLINGINRKIVENKLIKINDSYEMDYDNLEELFKKGHKVLILCSPHNPIGRIWTEEEIEKVIRLAKKYGVFVIFDEIHSDLNITNRKFVSGASFVDIYDNIAICNAPSKAFNLAGLHTSYIIIPNEELRKAYIARTDREFLNHPSVFGYRSMIAAYTNGDEWIEAQNKHLLNNYNYLKSYLNEQLPELIVTKLEGTYLVWLDFSYTNLNTSELLDKCTKGGITCSGGVNFGSDYESYLRFNIACSIEQLKAGLELLVKIFKS